jgi:hypothetical protein
MFETLSTIARRTFTIAVLVAFGAVSGCGDTGEGQAPATTTNDTIEGTVPYNDTDDPPVTVGDEDDESPPDAGGFGESTGDAGPDR